MKMKSKSIAIIMTILAVLVLATAQSASAATVTIQAGTYEELRNALRNNNPGGSQYETNKNNDILIELTGDLDVYDLGDLGGRGDETTGATLTISRSNVAIDGGNYTINSRGYPAFHVEGGRTEDARLTGITIENVTVDGAGYQLKMGGGMFFENKADIALRNSTIRNGSARLGGGGGFYAGPHGGSSGPTVTVENCAFEGNTTVAGSGGAILGFYASLDITDSTFDGNSAPLGGAISLYGNGARLAVRSSNPGDSTFENNEATHSGGAVHVVYASSRAASRGTPVIATTDIEADINATFSGNTAGVAGTEDYVFGVAYDPATYAGEVSDSPPSKLTVNGGPAPAVFFADAERTKLFRPGNKFIEVGTYRELQEALGYCKFENGDFEKDEGGHGVITEGTADDGDIVYLAGDLESYSPNPEAAVMDDITGATVYVSKNVSIFGNGHTIEGKGFPVFNVEGGANDDPQVEAAITNLKIEDGGYNLKLGGALFVEGNALLSVYRSEFANCSAGGSGGGTVGGGGGAIYLEPHGKGTPKLYVANSAFTGNKALNGTGGAISAYMGNVTITGSTFENNEAASGGAVGLKGIGKLDILAGNTFSGNKAEYAGGAVDIHHGRSFYKSRGVILSADSRIETTVTGVSEFSGNEARWGGELAFSRYYDSNYAGDRLEKPTVTFGPATGASMDIKIVTDITFSDIYRTEKAVKPTPSPTPSPAPEPAPEPEPEQPAPDPDPGQVPAPGPSGVGDATPSPSGTVEESIQVTGTDGKKLIVEEIPESENAPALQKLKEMGLSADVVGGEVVIKGEAVDIGTVTLTVTLENGETATVTFTVSPIEETTTKADTTASNWTGSLTESQSADGSAVYSFTVFVPIDLTGDEISKAADVNATISGVTSGGVVSITSQKTGYGRGDGEGAFVKISGTTTDPAGVAITGVTYRIGIRKYSQAMNVKLADIPDLAAAEAGDGSGSSSGGGCDAGLGFSLIATAGLALAKAAKLRGNVD
jgi:predicted outer membrane repeat protein